MEHSKNYCVPSEGAGRKNSFQQTVRVEEDVTVDWYDEGESFRLYRGAHFPNFPSAARTISNGSLTS
jgi:hypothetical protein